MKYINKTRFLALFFSLTLLFTILFTYANGTGKNISDSVVRLHILANSNSETDQNLKLKVRDRILAETSQLFCRSEHPDEALAIAQENIIAIKAIAEDEIRRQGFDYPVSVHIGESAFPTKVYGDIALPAGKYKSVRIEIGNARGENWWCVMYPPLCFTDGILSVPSDAKEKLKNNLSSSDYDLISQKSTPIKFKFKIVEIFQNIF